MLAGGLLLWVPGVTSKGIFWTLWGQASEVSHLRAEEAGGYINWELLPRELSLAFLACLMHGALREPGMGPSANRCLQSLQVLEQRGHQQGWKQ